MKSFKDMFVKAKTGDFGRVALLREDKLGAAEYWHSLTDSEREEIRNLPLIAEHTRFDVINGFPVHHLRLTDVGDAPVDVVAMDSRCMGPESIPGLNLNPQECQDLDELLGFRQGWGVFFEDKPARGLPLYDGFKTITEAVLAVKEAIVNGDVSWLPAGKKVH